MMNIFRRKIGVKVGAWFLLVALLPLATLTIIILNNTRKALIVEITAHLNDLLHEKTERIELYVDEQRRGLFALASVPSVTRAAEQLYCGQRNQELPEHSSVSTIDAEAEVYLRKTMQQAGYHDIFLIAPDGDIVYSVTKEDDLGTNLYHGPYRDSGLAHVFDKAASLLDSQISSFSFYPPSKKPAAFIATPIFGDNKLLGVIAVQLNEEQLFYIFADYLGLGESGELVASRVSGDNIVAAAPLRHRPDALGRKLLQKTAANSRPIQLAVSGQQGAGVTLDYRGVPIIGAWGYVPSMDWGLVVKIDKDEALAPIHRQMVLLAVIAAVIMVLVVGGIFLAAGSITRPIKQLVAVMQHFANGDFRARAPVGADDEVGSLVAHFNDMADTIEQYTFTMEQEVAQRTQELQQAKSFLDKAQSIAHLGSWQWDIVYNKLSWSDEIYRIFGLQPQQFAATYEAFLDAIHPDDRVLVTEAVNKSLETDIPYLVSHRVVRPDGSIRVVEERGDLQRDAAGQPVFMLGTVLDVTEIRNVQRRLNEYVDIIDENVLTSATDIEGNITYVSDAFCRASGYNRDELLGRNHRIIRHPEMPKELYERLWKTILGGAIWKGVFKNTTKDGGSYWVESTISPTYDASGNITGFTAIHNDITDKKRIEEISITDELTGLFNRRHFNEIFPEELQRARRDEKKFAFLMIDVDNFKKYNDTYGHQMGDHVLRQVGSTLKQALMRSGDFAFRLGGEEFGAIIIVKREEDAVLVADRIRATIEALRIPHEKNSPSQYVTISCGLKCVATDRHRGDDVEAVYRMADTALYQAKADGRNRVAVYLEG
ncbi:MAG: diguanylate cyclase [Desulfobulbaceae bacterium]|nr:diguanylate cyclase [Desulfobulbaceae bacterium]